MTNVNHTRVPSFALRAAEGRPMEHNAVRVDVYAAAVVSPLEMRANTFKAEFVFESLEPKSNQAVNRG